MTTDILISALGALGLGVVMFDVLIVTIGAGPFRLIARPVGLVCFRLIRRLPDRPLVHRLCGPMTMTAVGLTWVILIALFWAMIFFGGNGAVVRAENDLPVGWWLTFAHVGHLLSTVGGGLTKPGGTIWTLLSVAAGVNGMVVLTLSVSFVLSTTQTVTAGRAFLLLAKTFPPGTRQFSEIVMAQAPAIVSQIGSVPFALCYSAVDKDARVPQGLVRLLKHPDLQAGDARRLANLVAELPEHRLDPDARDFEDRIQDWARYYSVAAH